MKRLCAIVISLFALSVAADVVPPGSKDQIRERLQPFGEVCAGTSRALATGGTATGGAAMSGDQVYDQFCKLCHATGISDAPMLGDVAGWTPRIEKGEAVLRDSIINGLGVMPPKGACMNCSDDELVAALEHMLTTVR